MHKFLQDRVSGCLKTIVLSIVWLLPSTSYSLVLTSDFEVRNIPNVDHLGSASLVRFESEARFLESDEIGENDGFVDLAQLKNVIANRASPRTSLGVVDDVFTFNLSAISIFGSSDCDFRQSLNQTVFGFEHYAFSYGCDYIIIKKSSSYGEII